jgi:4-amino-4-deoxy-L-arabinose transferase-like glycosyltransferase
MRPDEARFIQQAQEMRDSRQWFMPTIGEVPNSDKPPVLFWLINLAAAWQPRISEAAARLPSALSSLVVLLLAMRLGNRLWGRKEIGLAGALVLLTINGFFHRAQWVSCDMPLTAFSWLAITFWREGLFETQAQPDQEDGWLDGMSPRVKIALGWLAASLGVMTKGLGLFWAVFWILGEAWARRSWRPLRRLAQPLGFALFLLPLALWLWRFAAAAGGERVYDIVVRQTGQRYVDAWNVVKPWYFYVYQLPADLLPWSVFLPLAAALLWRLRGRRGRGDPEAVGGLACLGFVVLALVFFSMSTGKRDVYLLPAYPALALLMARAAVDLGVRWDCGRRARLGAYLAFALTGLIPGVVLPLAVALGGIPALQEAIFHVGRPVVAALALGGVAIAGGALAACRVVTRRGRGLQALSRAFLGIAVFLLLLGLFGGQAANRHQSGAAFGEEIKRVVPPDGRMAVERGKFELFLYYSARKGTEWEEPRKLETELATGRCRYALMRVETLERLEGATFLSRLTPLLRGEVGGSKYVLLGPEPPLETDPGGPGAPS